MSLFISNKTNGERVTSFAKSLSRKDLDEGYEYTNFKCEDVSCFEELAMLILQTRYAISDYPEAGLLEHIDYVAVAKIMAETEFYGCKSPFEFNQTNSQREVVDKKEYNEIMLNDVNRHQKNPEHSFADCLAKPEYYTVKNYLYGFNEECFVDDITISKLEKRYDHLGEIVLLILMKEIDLAGLYANEAIIKLCNEMCTGYYGVFKSKREFLINHKHYCRFFKRLPTEYWACVDFDSLDSSIQNSGIDDAMSYRTIELNGQAHYYSNYMAKALQRISHIGVEFFNIYSV